VSNLLTLIKKQLPLTLSLIDGKYCEIFPHRLVYLEGNLSIIGENCYDQCIVFHFLKNIKSFEKLDLKDKTFKKSPQFTNLEVEEFVKGVRSVSGNVIRLILKIYTKEKLNLIPPHHYLERPCVITNSRGERIWAATVEPCEDLCKWVHELGNSVEIMDPECFSEDYMHFRKKLGKERRIA